MLSNHLILCYLLLLLPSICLSTILFQWIGSLAQVAKVLKFQLPHQSFQYLGLISFRIGWFDLLAIQGTLKSLQDHCLKASILWHLAFFMFQLSHPYMTTGETIALTIWIFVGKVMSLLFNMLSRFDIAFLLRSKRLLISWLQPLPQFNSGMFLSFSMDFGLANIHSFKKYHLMYFKCKINTY